MFQEEKRSFCQQNIQKLLVDIDPTQPSTTVDISHEASYHDGFIPVLISFNRSLDIKSHFKNGFHQSKCSAHTKETTYN